MRTLKEILIESGVLIINDKIVIPSWTKHVKLDIGLSYNAPMTQKWLTTEENLLVFAFEPNPNSIQCIRNKDNAKRQPGHGDPLEHRFLNDRAFVVPIALGSSNGEIDFYVTDIDEGSSSVYKPKESFRNIKQISKVPIFKLKDFFELIPWEAAPGTGGVQCIEYIKIDAQGHDLEIVKGLQDYISKVAYITLEPEASTYYNCDGNNLPRIMEYMTSRGFLPVKHFNTTDPTFINSKYLHLKDSIYIYQNG